MFAFKHTLGCRFVCDEGEGPSTPVPNGALDRSRRDMLRDIAGPNLVPLAL
jgi:hypothetical protein